MPLFIPARNSRHRTAALALYRALLRQGRSIKLPEDVCRHGRNPVPELIKRGFQRNRADVSPRLVFAALSAGYKFITLFKNAQTEGSKEHGEIVAYLREKNELIARSEANQRRRKKPPPPARGGRPKRRTVLKKISQPGETPAYVSPLFPRPRGSFKGRRKIPHVVVTSSKHAFLRLKSPQPRAVTNILLRKQARDKWLEEYAYDVEDGGRQHAAAEDNWDRLMEEQLAKLGLQEPEDAGLEKRDYEESETKSLNVVNQTLVRRKLEEAERARALLCAIEEEKKLLAREVEEAKEYGVRILPTEEERLKPFIFKRRMRNLNRRKRFGKRKVRKLKSTFVGLEPTPIQV